MPVVDHGTVRLHVEEAGTGTPILFLHEFAGDHRSWAPQVRKLARRHRCLALAARGYPPSAVPDDADAYGQDLFDADALAALDGLGIEKAHVVGLSMGAYTALRLALKAPERLLSVTAAGGGSGASPATRATFYAQSLELADAIEASGRIDVELFAEGPTRVQLEAKDPAAFALFKSHLAEHPPHAAAMVLRRVQARRPSLADVAEGLRAIDVPTLLVVGDEDEPVLDVNLWLKRLMPAARLAVMPGTGHCLNLEEPEAFNALLGDFIAEVEQGRWRARDPRASAARGVFGDRA